MPYLLDEHFFTSLEAPLGMPCLIAAKALVSCGISCVAVVSIWLSLTPSRKTTMFTGQAWFSSKNLIKASMNATYSIIFFFCINSNFPAKFLVP